MILGNAWMHGSSLGSALKEGSKPILLCVVESCASHTWSPILVDTWTATETNHAKAQARGQHSPSGVRNDRRLRWSSAWSESSRVKTPKLTIRFEVNASGKAE